MKIRKYQNITSLNIQQKLKPKIKDEVEQTSKTSNVQLAEIRIGEFDGYGAVYPGRITRGVN